MSTETKTKLPNVNNVPIEVAFFSGSKEFGGVKNKEMGPTFHSRLLVGYTLQGHTINENV